MRCDSKAMLPIFTTIVKCTFISGLLSMDLSCHGVGCRRQLSRLSDRNVYSSVRTNDRAAQDMVRPITDVGPKYSRAGLVVVVFISTSLYDVESKFHLCAQTYKTTCKSIYLLGLFTF